MILDNYEQGSVCWGGSGFLTPPLVFSGFPRPPSPLVSAKNVWGGESLDGELILPPTTLQLPPLELTKLHRLPPPRNLPGKRSNYPPSNLRKSIDYPPPRNLLGKRSNYPPLELTKLHRLPPPRISPKNIDRKFLDPPSGFITNRALSIFLLFSSRKWYGGGNSTSAEEVLQIPASLP